MGRLTILLCNRFVDHVALPDLASLAGLHSWSDHVVSACLTLEEVVRALVSVCSSQMYFPAGFASTIYGLCTAICFSRARKVRQIFG